MKRKIYLILQLNYHLIGISRKKQEKHFLKCFLLIQLFVGISTANVVGQTPDILPNEQATDYNIIPKNPQSSEIESYINNGINPATGSASISIPLYTLTEDGVDLPLTLSYNASGIKVTDISSEVGLKWSLIAGGSISRTIKGLPDDDPQGWLYYSGFDFPDTNWNDNIECNQDRYELLSKNLVDIIPDQFSYDFNGHHGTFVFTRDKQVIKTINDELIIIPYFNARNEIERFEITDNKGVIYVFGGSGYPLTTSIESRVLRAGQYMVNDARTGSGGNEWKLVEIKTVNGMRITFFYESYIIDYEIINKETVRSGTNLDTKTPYAFTSRYIDFIQMKLLVISSIIAGNEVVDFSYEDDLTSNLWKKKLKKITYTDNLSNASTSYSLFYDNYSGCNKLRLREVHESGNDETIGKKWKFNYKSDYLPEMDTKDFDYFGYYNSAGNTGFVPINMHTGYPVIENSRNVNDISISNGVLNEVIYPTGGKTKYHYESNSDIDETDRIIYAPGLRVSMIEDYDSNGTLSNKKKYVYTGLSGNTRVKDLYNFYYRSFHEASCHMSYSEERDNYSSITGFCYDEIETHYYDNQLFKYKEIDKYSAFNLNNNIVPKLIESRSYNELGNLINKTILSYSTPNSMGNVKGWSVESKFILDTYWCGTVPVTNPPVFYSSVEQSYNNRSYKAIHLTSKKDIQYHMGDSIETNTTFEYNDKLQLEYNGYSSSVINQEIKYFYFYPDQMSNPEMYEKNIISKPDLILKYQILNTINLEEKGQLVPSDSELIGKTKIIYDDKGNPTTLYKFINNPSVDYLTFDKSFLYDPKGNIIEILDHTGSFTSILWSYANRLPAIIIKNASYSTVASKLQASFLEAFKWKIVPSLDDYETILMVLNSDNELLQSNSQITSYKYGGFGKITEVIDPRGVRVNYEYDNFFRLNRIGDHNDKTIESYEYKYVTGGTPIFW